MAGEGDNLSLQLTSIRMVLSRLISSWLEQAATINSHHSDRQCSLVYSGSASSLLLDGGIDTQHCVAAFLQANRQDCSGGGKVRETYTCERVLKGSHSSSRCSSGCDRTFARSVCTGYVSCSSVFLQVQTGQSFCGITAYGL